MAQDKQLIALIQTLMGHEPVSFTHYRDQTTVEVGLATAHALLKLLRDNGQTLFKQLVDICAVDYPDRPDRFEVIYNLLSYRHNKRLRVRVRVGEGVSIPTVTGLFRSAMWLEREVWDLFGIPFEGHPDLRRLLTDYDFDGHPLRKDFPLTGFVEVRYDPAQQKVIYEPVNLQQAYRTFDFESPWEGMLQPAHKEPLGKEAS